MTKKLSNIKPKLESISYYSLIIFSLTLPLSKAAVSFFVFWFLILVLIKKDYKNSFQILKENNIFVYIVIFLSYTFLSAFWSSFEEDTFKYLQQYSYWIIVPSIVILTKKEWLYNILNAFLIGMFISEIISYGIYFEILSGFKGGPSNPSPFMNTIHYSVFLAFTSLVLLYRFLYENLSVRVKVLLFIFFVITTTNLMISTGRTGQLAFFITLFVVFFIKFRVSLKSIIFSIIFSISVFSFAYNGLDLFKKRVDYAVSDIQNVVEEQNFDSSWGLRAAFWILAYDSFKESPIFGHGLGNHHVVAQDMIEKYNYPNFSKPVREFISSSHFHNYYLMLLVSGGAVSLFLFLLLFYKLYNLKIPDLEFKHISIIGLTIFLVSFIAEPLLLLKSTQIFILFIISISIVSSKKI